MGPMAVCTCAVLLLTVFRPGLHVSLAIFALSGTFAIYQIAANTAFVQWVPDKSRAQAFGLANIGVVVGQGAALMLASAAAEIMPPATVIAVGGGLGAVTACYLALRWRDIPPAVGRHTARHLRGPARPRPPPDRAQRPGTLPGHADEHPSGEGGLAAGSRQAAGQAQRRVVGLDSGPQCRDGLPAGPELAGRVGIEIQRAQGRRRLQRGLVQLLRRHHAVDKAAGPASAGANGSASVTARLKYAGARRWRSISWRRTASSARWPPRSPSACTDRPLRSGSHRTEQEQPHPTACPPLAMTTGRGKLRTRSASSNPDRTMLYRPR